MSYEAGITAIVRGVQISGLRQLTARRPGVCDNTRKNFPAGTVILWKSRNQLSRDERFALYPDGRSPYDVVVIRDECQIIGAGSRATPQERPQEVSRRNRTPFTPSRYQQEILQALLDRSEHILIRALAGSGKTSTLVWLIWEFLSRGLMRGKNVIYLAFNKNIQIDLQAKLAGTNVPAKTTHSFALSQWLDIPAKVKIKKGNSKSEYFFLKGICDRLGLPFNEESRKIAKKSSYYENRKLVYELVDYIKNWAICPAWNPDGGWQFTVAQVAEVESFISRYKMVIESDKVGEVVDWACSVVSLGTPNPGDPIEHIDFNDMIYLPLVLDLPTPKYDLVFTDESQDFNRAQLMLLQRLEEVGARIVAVGDDRQGLYRFRGAAGHAMKWLGELFEQTKAGLHTCQLPINYRSDKAIIRWANQWVPDLQCSKQAEGEVRLNFTFAQALEDARNDPNHSYAFLCRTNLPLIVTAYQLIAKRKRIHILGRETFGSPILSLIGDLCGRSRYDENYCNRISDRHDQYGEVIETGLLTRLSEHMKTQRAKLKGDEHKYTLEMLENYAECIEVIAANVVGDTVDLVREEIDNLFADEPQPGVINLATIHGAKGLEWDTVYIVRPDLLPHPSVQEFDEDGNVTEEFEQEINACYVAATRAKHRLRYIMNWPFGKGMGPVRFAGEFDGYGGTPEDVEFYGEVGVEPPQRRLASWQSPRELPRREPEPPKNTPRRNLPMQPAEPYLDDGEPFHY